MALYQIIARKKKAQKLRVRKKGDYAEGSVDYLRKLRESLTRANPMRSELAMNHAGKRLIEFAKKLNPEAFPEERSHVKGALVGSAAGAGAGAGIGYLAFRKSFGTKTPALGALGAIAGGLRGAVLGGGLGAIIGAKKKKQSESY